MGYELGIIGAGNMAEAIARGVLARGLFKPSQIIAADPSPQRRGVFESLSIVTTDQNTRVGRESRAILLSVKPQQMADVLRDLAQVVTPETLFISIAAGISTSFIQQHLLAKSRWRIVRVMPNTPMLVGQGVCAIAPGANATPDDLAYARRLFESAGTVIDVEEDKMNAVTALSGSGPAYFFYLVEQMIRAATEMGLSHEQAHTLATRTALGAATMLTTSIDTPEQLRHKVTSPGGTTQAAIEFMESRQTAQIIVDAIKAAEERGRALGQ